MLTCWDGVIRMRIDKAEDCQTVVDDAIALARMEGLEAHARAAEQRKL